MCSRKREGKLSNRVEHYFAGRTTTLCSRKSKDATGNQMPFLVLRMLSDSCLLRLVRDCTKSWWRTPLDRFDITSTPFNSSSFFMTFRLGPLTFYRKPIDPLRTFTQNLVPAIVGKKKIRAKLRYFLFQWRFVCGLVGRDFCSSELPRSSFMFNLEVAEVL